MATTIKESFDDFSSNLEITDRQVGLVSQRRKNVVDTLDSELSLHSEKSKLIGSYDRHTMIRYLSEGDVDVMVILHYGDNKEWDNPDGTIRALDCFKAILDDVYMHKRIHSSLGYLTPAEFEAQWREEHVLALEFELRTA